MKKRYNVHFETRGLVIGRASRCIYLSLTLGTAKFKHLDESCSLL